jgi:hypothetical protein
MPDNVWRTIGRKLTPPPDPDPSLRDRIAALAHRHRRDGAGMIYLKLRQEGRVVNHKRVDRLYAEAPAAGPAPASQEGAAGGSSAAGPA